MPLFLHPILESVAFCPHLPRQQKAPRFFWEDDCANFWPACPDLRRGMSPHSGVSQVPRLRAETHFGVQARALPVGLHPLRHQPLRNCKSDNGLLPAKELACLRETPSQEALRRAGAPAEAGSASRSEFRRRTFLPF